MRERTPNRQERFGAGLAFEVVVRQQRIPEKKFQKRKTARAISLRGANHITLRANVFVLRRNHLLVKRLIRETQFRYGLRLRAVAIMGNHLHLAARVPSRKAFGDAMRFLASRIARAIGSGCLWTARVWSRPVRCRRDLDAATAYIARNPIREGIFDGRIDSLLIVNGILESGSPKIETGAEQFRFEWARAR